MTQFNEAARKAADTVFDWYDDPDEEHRVTPEFAIPILQKKIQDDFAEIEAVFGKLVELVKAYGWDDDLDKIARIQELLADPQVKAAMERSKG